LISDLEIGVKGVKPKILSSSYLSLTFLYPSY